MACIMQVELSLCHDGDDMQEVVDIFHFDMQELLNNSAEATAEIVRRAQARVGDRTMSRLAYMDDEGDWCTLNKDTFSDAVQFASEIDVGVRQLQVRVLTTPGQSMAADVAMKVEPSEEAPPTSSCGSASSCSSWQNPAENDQQKILEQVVLKELNNLAANADMRHLLPKLAAAGLRIVEESQHPALFTLVEVLAAFRDGELKAESLPSVLPQLVSSALQLPGQAVESLLLRVKEEAQKALAELKQEQAASGAVEVHPNIVCDACDASPLIGGRYKSLTVENYDLCEACFRKSPRDESAWTRVRSDVTGTVVSSFYGTSEAAPQDMGTLTVSGPATAVLEAAEEAAQQDQLQQSQAPEEDHKMDEAPASSEQDPMAFLLGHPDPAVRKAAEAIQGKLGQQQQQIEEHEQKAKAVDNEAAAKLVEEAAATPVEEANDSDSLGDEWAMADNSSRGSLEKEADDVETADATVVSEEAPAASSGSEHMPSACIVSGAPLMLGVEAQEDEAARGDVTAEFAQVIAGAGARQAFRLGRIALPAGGDESASVPVCAKIVARNDGKVLWPETTAVAVTSGEAFGFPHMQLGALTPGEAAEVMIDLTVPAKPAGSTMRSSWAIIDSSNGKPLGPVLILEVMWVAQ
eukprot:TRINITY_DN105720_c0_g1_i1.p1 TRINITY_DN105720_c0_g1~~TRINITY_DN105720_c0_g1_i1.p1  ORF type:complete len:659 (-),score=202.57 TRINITY_DN105720_c0_g1_i1:62-1969(-)